MEIDFERYKRNIILKEVGLEGQKKLSEAKVLVAGCGGLGSFVIMNLAALGVGHLGLLDNDTVEISNLNRQIIHTTADLGREKVKSAKAKVEAFNPDIKTETYQLRLDLDNYKDVVCDYDLIIDCFDSFNSKFILNDIALKTGKILIHGGVGGFKGQIMTILPNKSACLRCLLGENPNENKDTPNSNPEKEVIGVVAPSVSLVASYESAEALKLILNVGNPLINKVLTIDLLSARQRVLNLAPNKNCVCQK